MVVALTVWEIAQQQVADACDAFEDKQPHLRSAGLHESDPSLFRATLLVSSKEVASAELLHADVMTLLRAVQDAGFAFEDPNAPGAEPLDLAIPVDLGPHIDALEAAEQEASKSLD
jgi:hypothetical protein